LGEIEEKILGLMDDIYGLEMGYHMYRYRNAGYVACSEFLTSTRWDVFSIYNDHKICAISNVSSGHWYDSLMIWIVTV